MPAPESVRQLIETFGNNLDFYKSSRYNEAQLRQEFLDPFFKALGWDMDNEAGLAPQYRDVIHEASIKIGGATKAPDYAFSIHGQYKFFLEAKKPSVNIQGDTDPAYQLRRYGWSAKLPVSILTDFEEFAIYDCRKKPKRGDRASTSRLGYFKYTDYIDKWDELRNTYSKEAILKGSFDKYAVDSKRHRGTDTVDNAFLEEIEHWRSLLAKNFALRNSQLTVRDLNYAVQKTIDRLIFLRICEDRGTEDYKELASLLNGGRIYPRLLDLFMQADARYNSGLFHFSAEKGRGNPDSITPNLELDDSVVKEIISKLYYPESPYEFSVLPADILGQVYEQFLGKTIHLTPAHQAKIEEKPEVRKAGGVYYTPKYVVDYIVDNTLGRLLNGADPENRKPIPVSHAEKIKVVDPACGSGSFLIAAYQYLLDWHRDQYSLEPVTCEEDAGKIKRHSSGKSPKLYQAKGGEWRLTTAERKRILLNNIHGVDIDSQAVEVTKLSLLLKVLEGETQQNLQRDFLKERERILPDLGHNIRCGNSLIGPDLYDQLGFTELDDETNYRVNVFDWLNAFPKVFEQGGFDCVIGNPPYGAALGLEEKSYFSQKYTCQSYQLDSYLLFLEKAVSSLVREGGTCGYIIPNPWLTNLRQQATRRYICSAVSIKQIVHFYFPVFKDAVVDTEILILDRPMDSCNDIEIKFSRAVTPEGSLAIESGPIHKQQEWLDLDGGVINIFLSPEKKKLFNRILGLGWPLDRWFKINVGIKPYQTGKGNPPQTKEQVVSRPFDSSTQIDDSYREILRGKDIDRYCIQPVEQKYLKYGPWIAEPRPAANFDADQKLLVRQTGDRPIAAIDQNQRLAMNNLHVLVPLSGTGENISFLIGIINSRLLTWVYRCINPEDGEALAEVKRQNVAALPIRPIDFKNPTDVEKHDLMTTLVNRMTVLQEHKRVERNPDTLRHIETEAAATDRRIDQLVYDLFGLSDNEINLVEQDVPANVS